MVSSSLYTAGRTTDTSSVESCTQKRQFVNLEPTPTNHYERRWHSFFLDKRTKTSVLSVIYVYVSYFRHLYTDRLFVKIRTSERGVQKRNSPRKILSRQFKVLISYPYILGSTFISEQNTRREAASSIGSSVNRGDVHALDEMATFWTTC